MLYLSLSVKMQTVVGYYVQCVNVCRCAVNNGYLSEGLKHPLRSSIVSKTWHNNAHKPVSLISLFLTMVDLFVEPR